MASKYLLAIGKKHLFNPAALAVALSASLLGVYASWWVAGNTKLIAFVLIGGVMIAHKLRKFDLIFAFVLATVGTTLFSALDPLVGVEKLFIHTSLLFFAFVMLTEPLTMPPTRMSRVAYGALVGVLFVPATHIGSFSFTPELALLVGNLFAYIVSPKGRYMLTFGQYLEWTLSETSFDSRGNRRYLTIASAPENDFVALGVRFYDKPSAFKQALAALPAGAKISVASLSGDFTMPKDTKKKLAFLAGGIGVTPFASMARHVTATGETRDAVLLYSSKTAAEVAYQDVFAQAAPTGFRTVYVLSDEASAVQGVYHGFINADLIKKEVPDYTERTFYISGPPGMVNAMKQTLLTMGVSRLNIKTDFFPGLA
jgi:ferredoxin-NADP reductase